MVPKIGASDLLPFPNTGYRPSWEEGGSLVGPNHPIFHPDDGGQFLPPGVPPGARFDPFFPIPGPLGTGITGPFPGSVDNRGRGRGRGRGMGRGGTSGEPNPDHLKPPNEYDGYI